MIGTKLLATRDVEDYWSEKPPKRHIHVIVVSRNCLTESLKASINKSVHDTVRRYRESKADKRIQVDRKHRTSNPRES
ncbi:8180_t:CDS:2 [Paraglomus occultum]|uniref:8180_t:CDS:1 n=1 Tax=Paraglomus occultum TaxID=144539 RepID=A0A9N9BJ76_9GLOM|nr:8180_t:CDS:2 [Paraglomus occultum]